MRALVITALVAVLAALGATSASAEATLDWKQWNQYNIAADPGNDRTWLGYVTNTVDFAGPGSASNGSQVPSNGATGDTVTTASARGDNDTYVAHFPVVNGQLVQYAPGGVPGTTAATLQGSVQYKGTLTWDIHGEAVKFSDPLVVLYADGTGSVFASGSNNGTPFTGRIFELDLDGQAPNPGAPNSSPGTQLGFDPATLTANPDGTTTIGGIVPKIASPNNTAQSVFGAAYVAGVGPDRVPARFGSFSLTIPATQSLTAPPTIVNVPGPTTTVEKTVQTPATSKTFTVKTAPFGSKAKGLVVKVTKKGKFVGYAEVTNKKIKFLATELKIGGTYKLTTVSGKKKSASVKLG